MLKWRSKKEEGVVLSDILRDLKKESTEESIVERIKRQLISDPFRNNHSFHAGDISLDNNGNLSVFSGSGFVTMATSLWGTEGDVIEVTEFGDNHKRFIRR